MRKCWAYACVAGIFLAVFAAYPQLKLWTSGTSQWQGHYAYNDIDEVAYAAYLKALIDGRPRKNDPYTGRDESPESPQPESLFSIQFASPYMVALPARLLGISAPTAMTLAGVMAAIMSAFICFLMVREISGSDWVGMAGALFVLCGGALFAGEGAIGEVLGIGFPYPYFPFLRRYIPAVPFPVFLFLIFAVWRLVNSDERNKRIMWCAASSLSFAFLVFSYFYIWTAAAAWLFCIGVGILLFRPEKWKRQLAILGVLAGTCIVPLIVYAYLLAQRSPAMDHVQLLVRSRALDLDRVPLFLGLAALLVALLLAAFGKTKMNSLLFVFTAVTGAVPFVLFNQQVITGMSLQPIHYQVFIGNYIAGLSLVFAVCLLIDCFRWTGRPAVRYAALGIAIVSVVWGFVECHYTVRVLDGANIARDQALSVGRFLKLEAASSPDPFRDTILSFSNLHADDSPTVAPQNVLWSRHQHVFAGLNWQESKERFYRQLYYRDLEPAWLERQLKSRNFVAMIALFGWGRHSGRLSSEATPLSFAEIDAEVERYRVFYGNFGRDEAYQPEIDFLVVPDDREYEFENLSIWYSMSLLETTGGYRIYRLSPK
ncbi:MAG: hypothetical protein OEM82_01320 [Acidobacteriota bacterium]|nr:hypothetical protein [Acidobacteriota bacterium]